MKKIIDIKAREILDSRGNPTVECDLLFEDNTLGRAAVPSGASNGKHEAIELRDEDYKRYKGKGVQKAVSNILNFVSPKIINKSFESIYSFDEFILSIDGTKNKSNLGANATLSLSLAFAKALAFSNKKQFFEFLSSDLEFILPVPMMNIINGGSHADNSVDIQEFMVMPAGAASFSEALRMGTETFHHLKKVLSDNSTVVEDALRTKLGKVDWLFVLASGGGGTGRAWRRSRPRSCAPPGCSSGPAARGCSASDGRRSRVRSWGWRCATRRSGRHPPR